MLAWSRLGELYLQDERMAEASAAFRAASLLEPENPLTLCNVMHGARTFDREVEAVAVLRRALTLDPELPEAWHNLGAITRNLGDLELAFACYQHASTLWSNPKSVLGMAEVLTPLGRSEESLGYAERAITNPELEPKGLIEARMARGLARLLTGDLGGGFDDLEARLERRAFQNMTPSTIPAWTGPESTPERLLVWREQGVGDEIRFLSCLPDLLRDVDTCTVRCDPRLARIIARSFPVEVEPGKLAEPDDCTAAVAMGTLPAWYRRAVTDFPESPAYLVPDADRVAEFRDRLGALSDRPKVGFSWRSKLLTNKRNANYPDPECLAAFAGLDGVDFIDLQYDHQPEEVEMLASEYGLRIHHLPDLDLTDDLDGVLALCAALDEVVTVGNALAELAGAVGTPTSVLIIANAALECASGETSLWHRNTRFFPRPWTEPWQPTVDAAAEALRRSHCG